MICSSGVKDMTSEEIDSIGKEFASRYYGEFVGKPDASALIRFFDLNSRYSFVQRCSGRPDYEVRGADLIGQFAERMQYGRCTAVTVLSADTTRVGSTRFKVSVVGELLCPQNDVARKFLQTAVIRRVAWTRARFLVVATVFEFDDRIVDDILPKTSSVDKNIFDPLLPPVVVAAHHVDVGRKSAKPAAVKGHRRQESSPLRSARNSKLRYVRTMDVFNSNAVKNPKRALQRDDSKTVKNPTSSPQESDRAASKLLPGQLTGNCCKGYGDQNGVAPGSPNKLVVASRKDKKASTPDVKDTRTTCVRKAKNAAKDPMADLVPSYVGGSLGVSNRNVKQKAGSEKPPAAFGDSRRKSGPHTDDDSNGLAITVVVSNEKPLAAKAQPISVKPMTSTKVESKKTPSAGEKAVTTVVDKKLKVRRPNERPTRGVGNAKICVSTNRFACLMVDDGFDSHSSDADDLTSPSENTAKDLTGRKKKNLDRNNRLRSSPPTLADPNNSCEKTNICKKSLSSPRTLAGLEETTAAGVPTEREISAISADSSPNDSGERSKNLVTRDPSSNDRLKTLDTVPNSLIVSPPSAPFVVADDVSALDSAQKEPNRRSKNMRGNRKINKENFRDGTATAVVNEGAKGQMKSEKFPPIVTSQSYIRRVGSIYGRLFIREVIYPLFYNINPLDWC